MVKNIQADELDLIEHVHVSCGGMIFENTHHAPNERRFWCMNCDHTLVLLEEKSDEQPFQGHLHS